MASVITVRRIALIILLVGVVLAAIVVVHHRSDAPHLPRVTVTLVGGPKNYEWTITTASHGSGFGYSTLVIQYPDGHRRVWGGTVLDDSATGSDEFNTFKDMAPGDYRYFVYGGPTNRKLSWYEVPPRDRVAKNLIASGGFSIP